MESHLCICCIFKSATTGARLPYPQVLPQWESNRIWRRQVMLLILLYWLLLSLLSTCIDCYVCFDCWKLQNMEAAGDALHWHDNIDCWCSSLTWFYWLLLSLLSTCIDCCVCSQHGMIVAFFALNMSVGFWTLESGMWAWLLDFWLSIIS